MEKLYIPIGGKQDEESVLSLLNVSRTTFARIRHRFADFPKPIVYSKSCVRYKKADVLAWMESKKGAANDAVRVGQVTKNTEG